MKKRNFLLLIAMLFTLGFMFNSCGERHAHNADGNHIEEVDGHGHDGDHDGHDHSDHEGHNHDDDVDHGDPADNENAETIDVSGPEYTSAYVCPMHCKGSGSATAGKCPVCKMNYVAKADHEKKPHNH